jgi:hypothetical protein
MSSYTKRQWELTVDDEVIIQATNGQQFKCTFEIMHDFGGSTSYADIAIYNLTADTANKTLARGKSLSFKAGYEDSIDNIFSGTIKNVLYERVGPDTITRLICKGGKLFDSQSQVNETPGKDVTVAELIRICVKAMGYPIVMDDTQFDDIPPYVRGYPLDGDPKNYLEKLSKAHGFNYVIENDRMIVLRNNFARKGPIHVVSQFTGMEGIPEITEVGVDVTIRLNPKIRIGGKYRLESELATFNFSNLYFVDIPESAGQGEYIIFKLTYSGDSKGDAWSTKITGYRELTSSS